MGYIKEIKIGTGTDAANLIEPVLYAVTSDSTSAYTASIENFELVTGVVITLKIHATNAANATLKINSGAAKSIKYKNAPIAANALSANRFYSFLYDGNAWQVIGELDTNTTYSAGTGIAITDNTIRNAGVREITTSSDSNGALKVNTNGTETAVFVKGIEDGYLNIHPENIPILIPFMHNDIAHLLKRGGSATISYDGVTQSNLDLNPCFNGSGSYWSVSGNINTIVIELILFKVFVWTSTIYVDFGSASWRAKSVKIEAMNTNYTNDTWTVKLDTTSNNSGHVSWLGTHTPNGASNGGGGFNKLRFTFSNFNSISTSGGSFRISQIGIYNYASLGLREPYMSRGEDDPVFRNITPNTTNIYNLGSNDKKWANVYATTFTGNLTGNVTGNVSGTASNVTGTVAIDHGGTNATTAAGARTNLGLGTIATETATNYLKWQTTSITTTNTIYDFGVYVNQGSADTSTTPSGISYYNILNIPYRKASGNNKADYAWSIGSSSNADNRLFFRTSGPNTYGTWQEVAHAPVGTVAIGSSTQPVYMTATGVITAGTTYAGGTAVTLNNSSKAGSTASFYAPTAGGTANTQALVGNGATSAPKWANISPSISITAGTSSAAPSINVTVLGQSGAQAQAITIASTSVYGVTKLQDGVSSTSIALAATANAAYTASRSSLHTLATTTKYYITGTTSATTSTGGDSFDTGVYVTATAGELSAVKHSFNVSGTEKATMQYDNDIESIVFSFV